MMSLIGPPLGFSGDSMVHSTGQGTYWQGIVSARRASERRKNKPKSGASFSKGIRTHGQMSGSGAALRRLHRETRVFRPFCLGERSAEVSVVKELPATYLAAGGPSD